MARTRGGEDRYVENKGAAAADFSRLPLVTEVVVEPSFAHRFDPGQSGGTWWC